MPQMENTCKLRAKCLKKDEPLDKCNNPECQTSFTQVVLTTLRLHLLRKSGRALSFVGNDSSMPTRRCKRLQQTR